MICEYMADCSMYGRVLTHCVALVRFAELASKSRGCHTVTR